MRLQPVFRVASILPVAALVFVFPSVPASRTAAASEASAAMGPEPIPCAPWPAMDALGRRLPLADETGPPRENRYVGIFYFLWLGQHGAPDEGPFNVSEILKRFPQALFNPASPPWGPEGAMHYWGEPLFGYYRSEDRWVIRRHARLLADAGIDTLIFDTSNAVTYREVYRALCEVFSEIRAEGGRTPHIAFMTNTRAGETARALYEDLYRPGLHRELWFEWLGKPLMICDPAEADDELGAFFTLRKAHWPFTQVNTRNAWHWEAAYPQVYGYTDGENVPEQVNVSVAQNLRQSDGAVTPMSRGDARGRGFHNRALDTRPGSIDWGYNFQEQWSRAFELDPPFAMVTGWNEWIAGRYKSDDLPVMFVDQFDRQCSRDIEMMRGGHGDNYYLQLIANVRRFKGASAIPPAGGGTVSIDLAGGFGQWDGIKPLYRDPPGDTGHRDHRGVGGAHYENRSGRNDFIELKACRDAERLYFYAGTSAPLSPWEGSNWMLLLIDADQNPETGWEGFDYCVNRTAMGPTRAMLEKNTGGWNWEKAGEAEFRSEGNRLQLAVPLDSLGMDENEAIAFDFKWIDNWQNPGDILDVYSNGDTAPDGRFAYRYTVQ